VTFIIAYPDTIEKNIKNAETYFWIAIEEKGNMEAYNKALLYLDKASSQLNSAKIKKHERDDTKATISSLQNDIIQQADIAHDTFWAVYPLTKLINTSIFMDALAYRTYELVDDPAVMAASAAALKLVDGVLSRQTKKLQFDVFFTSTPQNIALENEVLYVFNLDKGFYVHNKYDLAQKFSDEEIVSIFNNSISDSLLLKVAGILHNKNFIILNIEEYNSVEEICFYILKCNIYSPDDSKYKTEYKAMGFSRDKTGHLTTILILNLVFLILAIIIFIVIYKNYKEFSIPALLIIPIIAFIIGRTLPWFVIPVLVSIAPLPENLAKLSFWWPALAGSSIILLPLVFYKVTSMRFQSILEAINLSGRMVPVFLAMSLGTVAYFITPFILLKNGNAVIDILLIFLGLLPTAYILGRSFEIGDTNIPIHISILYLAYAIWLGTAIFIADSTLLGSASILIVLTSIVISIYFDKHRVQESAPDQIQSEDMPDNLEDLVTCINNPKFIPFKSFNTVKERISPFFNGQTQWLAFVGESGIGKTATSKALINFIKESNKVTVLSGECPQIMGESIAYAPFKQALSNYFNVSVLDSSQQSILKIDEALEGIFDTVLPFSNILFPPINDDLNTASSQKEVFLSIIKMLKNLAKKRSVVIFLDDVHWIDESSGDLIRFIFEHIPGSSNHPILFILTSRTASNIKEIGLAEQDILELNPLTELEKVELLEKSLGFNVDIADAILRKIGFSENSGELFWLLQIVKHLAQNDYFKCTENGFTWTEKYNENLNLPIPEEFQELLKEELDLYPQYRTVFECAACIGQHFNASILAESLQMNRIEMLNLLNKIEQETGIIYDDLENDDMYSFKSSFHLEMIRKKLKIRSSGPSAKDVPQIIREYHLRLATALESTLSNSPAAIYSVANHFFASGLRNVNSAYTYCIKASHAASAEFLFNKAEGYLEMAEECGQFLIETFSLAEEKLLLMLNEIHVTQDMRREDVARRGLEFIKNNASYNHTLLLKIIRACFDAGKATGNLSYYDEAIRLSQDIVKKSDDNIEKAEAFQFMGICTEQKSKGQGSGFLRQALDLFKLKKKDPQSIVLYGRIINSLAEILSYADHKQKEEAKKLYSERIKLNSEYKIGDKPGLARSHGGLGRLYFFEDPPDIENARHHFNEDLELAVDLGDLSGQAKMFSFLGGCDLADNDPDSALQKYQESFKLSESNFDKYLALAGLIESTDKSGKDMKNLKSHSIEILNLLKEDTHIPDICISVLRKTIEQLDVDKQKISWLDKIKMHLEQQN